MPPQARGGVPLEQAFGEALRSLRESQELSQEELAHRSGIYRTHVGMLERGQRRPSLVTVFKLARALELEPSEMLQSFERKVTREV